MTDTQIFQLFGLAFFSIGVGMLVNPKFSRNIMDDLEKNAMAAFMGGAMSLAIGYLIVTFHNTWNLDSSLIITVVGWVAIFKGIGFLAVPQYVSPFYRKFFKKRSFNSFAAWFVTALGFISLILGFLA